MNEQRAVISELTEEETKQNRWDGDGTTSRTKGQLRSRVWGVMLWVVLVWEAVGQTLQILKNVKHPHYWPCRRGPTDHSSRIRRLQYTYSHRIRLCVCMWERDADLTTNMTIPFLHPHRDTLIWWNYGHVAIQTVDARVGVFDVWLLCLGVYNNLFMPLLTIPHSFLSL